MKKIDKFLNEDILKIKKIDFIVIGILVLIYGIISFINLGDMKAPQTYYDLVENEMITIELKNTDDVIKLKYYELDDHANLQIDLSENNVDWYDAGLSESEGSFAWTEYKILKKAKYIRITALENSSLGEVALYGNNNQMITLNSIYSNDKKIDQLTDEQELIPEKVSYMNSTYFDEVYFARSAYEYVHNLPIYEWTHPPLGKLIQAIPIKISNTMAPFFYRFMGNIAGILMIPIMYLLGKELFRKRKYALFSALLVFLDNFHFAQTRMGTVDSFLILFVICSFLFMFRFINKKGDTINLLLSGLFLGLAISVKWTGFYALLALIIIYLIDIIKNKKINIKLIIKSIIFFIIIPLSIYLLSFYVFPKLINFNYHFSGFIDKNINMYNYHASVGDSHKYASKWYQWPIFYNPVWYYTNVYDFAHVATITGLGNIAIWWFSIIAFIYLIVKVIKKRDLTSIYLLITVLCTYLPYIFINRIMFQYHYFIVMPFLILVIVNLFRDIEDKYKINYLIPLYLVLVLIVFIMFFPITSGIPITYEYSESLKLLSSWDW